MPFTGDILKYRSLAIIGMEKNTGKTECLNYVISGLKARETRLAITSIGIDGESTDQVTRTSKPEITLCKGMLFVTAEKHFRTKRLTAEILDISRRSTSLGRLVTARVIEEGKALIAGPSDTAWLKEIIENLPQYGADLTIVDGALSRKSLGSPTVTDAIILSTGAALSANLRTLAFQTKYTYDLISLPVTSTLLQSKLADLDNGVWAISKDNEIIDLGITSLLNIEHSGKNLLSHGSRLFVPGAITDKMLNFLKIQKQIEETEIIIKDFTRVFASPESYYSYISRGGKFSVLKNTKLLAITVNPVSPSGFILNSEETIRTIQEVVTVPVYDLRQINN